MSADTPKVYSAIAAVTADIGKEGIAKGRKNAQQGYAFRGIDEIYNALSPVLSRHKLCILPRILTRVVTERQTQKGGALFSVVVEAEFDFISAEDGSRHVVRTFGEAMDSADKATNKAMSAAYKYAAMQAFCIPTEGDNDSESETHQIASERQSGIETPFDEQEDLAEQREGYVKLATAAIKDTQSEADLREWWGSEKERRRVNRLTQDDVDMLRSIVNARIVQIQEAARTAPVKIAPNGRARAEVLNDEIPF